MSSSSLKVSVALCTCNGERFLAEQLESIAAQSRPPTEVVACDDASEDGTRAILERFRASARFPVRIELNARRLGSTKNFEKAIAMCSGDVIALCDQDDVWKRPKLERLGGAFERQPDLLLVFSDADIVDHGGRPLGYSLWSSRAIPVTARRQRRIADGGLFSILIRYNIVTGATAAISRRLAGMAVPIPPTWVHDAWLGLIAAGTGRVACVPERLTLYRQHSSQQIGGRRLSIRQQIRIGLSIGAPSFRQVCDNIEGLTDRLRGLGAPPPVLQLLDCKAMHFARRLRMREVRLRSWFMAIRELTSGRYSRVDLGWKSFAQDLFAPRVGITGRPSALWGARI